jgi:hypothetical protein
MSAAAPSAQGVPEPSTTGVVAPRAALEPAAGEILVR